MLKEQKYHWFWVMAKFSWFIILGLFAIGCQPTDTEPNFSGQVTVNATATPTQNPIYQTNESPSNSLFSSDEYSDVDIYRTILQRYADVLSDPMLPQETRTALLEEQAIMVADATAWAVPISTIDPSVDWNATAESIRATVYATPYVSPTPIRGMLYGELAEGDPRNPAQTNTGWLGYVQGVEIGVIVGRFGWGIETGYLGLVDLYDYSIASSSVYTQPIGEGITETLKLQAVLEDRYLVMEVFDYAEVKQPNSIGTGEMYYFDMVAREFLPQPMAELWIENFPGGGGHTLQAVATPTTPPIFSTAVPSGPTLHWNTQHSQDCWGSGGWSVPANNLPTNGQQSISAQVITTYYLTCFNPVVHTTAWTAPDTGSLMVTSDFRANNQAPLFTSPNTPITLQWGASYSSGQNCQASGAWSGTKGRMGTEQLAGLTTGKYLFTLTCEGEILSVLVIVANPLPTPTPTPTPSPTATATPSPTPTPAPLVLQRVVQQGSDDADQNLTTGQTFLYNSKLNVASNGSTPYLVGLRFQNITIPAGATILNATLQLEAEGTHSGTTVVEIYGQASDNPTKFTETYGDISSRPRTTAFTTWNVPPWVDTGGVSDWDDSVNLAAIVQELINRPNWQSGNALAFIIEGEGRRVAGSFNGSTNANAPVLHITYTVP